MNRTVLVTGGAGYVGSALVPKLLAAGHRVKVIDLYPWGPSPFQADPNLTEIEGDIRDRNRVDEAMSGCDSVIHLACISNDPSFELDPELGKSINYDCFPGLVESAKDHGVERFVYASSSSVYGIKDVPEVHEELALEPLTDYSTFKAMCEEILLDAREDGFRVLVLRPATVCGYSPRLRLDVVVNLLAAHAYYNRRIKVLGGPQLRPNIHIADMCALYLASLEWDPDVFDGGVYNAGYENHSVTQLAELVRGVVGNDVEVVTEPTNDLRSYHVSSKKIERELGFRPEHTIEEAVKGLVAAFAAGKAPGAMEDPRYYNIRTMGSISSLVRR